MSRSTKAAASLQKAQQLLDAAKARFRYCYDRQAYPRAIVHALEAARIAPGIPQPWADAAVCNVYLERWDQAVEYGLKAVQLAPNNLSALDALSHAYGGLKDWANVRRWGLAALQSRYARFAAPPSKAVALPALPPLPSAATRDANLIAFSLFGGRAKYCETAVLNAIEQPRVYPGWRCVFYVDDSVPATVVKRLQQHDALVERVSTETAARWPGPMWRFMAYDRPGVHRVMFRDADSVVTEREANAVAVWLHSGQHFHVMRDAATHTELILAGCWGAVAGAMPPMAQLVDVFLQRPLESRHFADQYFLREFVWPYAKQSLIQHDSMFGFLEAAPFPDGPQPDGWHVGYAEGSPIINMAADYPDGTPVRWTLYNRSEAGDVAVCTYPGVVMNKAVQDNLPRRYAEKVMQQQMLIRVAPQ